MNADFNNINLNGLSAKTQGLNNAFEAKEANGLSGSIWNDAKKAENLPDQSWLGKSQVKADNLQNDIKKMSKNPHLVEVSDKFFDKALQELEAKGDPNAYEKACMLVNEFVNEASK